MTHDTPNPPPTAHERPDRRRRAFVVALAAALALAGPLALGAVGGVAAQDGPTVRVTDTGVDPGGTATARVVLSSAPDGLAGYELVVSVGAGSVATLAGADYPDGFGLTTEPETSDDGRTIRLEAADVGGNVGADATDVTLATVELRGVSTGEVALEIRPIQFDADGGAPMDVGVAAGTAVVGEPTPTAQVTDEPTPTPTTEPGGADGSASARGGGPATADTATTTNTTSGQGSLPLAGVGAAALALVVAGALLVRRR